MIGSDFSRLSPGEPEHVKSAVTTAFIAVFVEMPRSEVVTSTEPPGQILATRVAACEPSTANRRDHSIAPSQTLANLSHRFPGARGETEPHSTLFQLQTQMNGLMASTSASKTMTSYCPMPSINSFSCGYRSSSKNG